MNYRTALALFVCFALLMFAAATSYSGVQTLALDGSAWQFRKLGDAAWLPAHVPGMVHLDLLRNNNIPDPFYGTNEERLQWIDSADWEYRTQFLCDFALLRHSNIDLVFEGLDTFAAVYLNDSLVLRADNMFRTWRVDCKRFAENGRNELRIVFASAVRRGRELSKNIRLTLPGDEKVFTRKAQYQFGWDWGPRFVSCGVWRSVRLEAWSDVHLESVALRQESLNKQAAHIRAEYEVNVQTEGTYIFRVQSKSAESKNAQGRLQTIVSSRRETLKRGVQTVSVEWIIPKPELWWSNGLGKPHLYSFVCDVLKDGKEGENIGSKTVSIGLRTIKIVQRPDSAGVGFAIELNGQPVFMKGANYIPPDSFLPRVTHETYKRIVQDAAEANMNMLRVWGGGSYEADDFYTLCDEHGILIWQDFMFACAMYPGDSAFVENVRREVVDNVKRLRNHPCIALWCGNNEIDEGWQNWGWQKQFHYSAADSATVWRWYETVFHNVLPEVLARYDGVRFYWRSSPQFGWGRKESLTHGDAHYWGVWWGLEPFSMYEKKVGRFMSEYGMQSLPTLPTIAAIATPQEQHITSATMKVHQKHPTGYENIQQYLQRDYKQPKNFEQYVYVSQLLQARGITTAIEAHRRAMPYCMGTLYWQLNDCWQVSSWSSVDYAGRWKALHYAVKELYGNLLLSVQRTQERTSNGFAIHLVSDIPRDTSGTLDVQLRSFDGRVLWSKSQTITAKANTAQICARVLDTELPNMNAAESVLRVRFQNRTQTLAEKLYYFVSPKDLKLTSPTIDYTLSSSSAGQFLTLRSTTLAKNVFLQLRGEGANRADDVRFSSNFFDVLPGEPKIVRIESKKLFAVTKEQIIIQSLIDSY